MGLRQMDASRPRCGAGGGAISFPSSREPGRGWEGSPFRATIDRVATTSPLRRLLRALTTEVSNALDRNLLDRSRRGEARVALLQAWVALNAPARAAPMAPLVRWTRRLDALLTPVPRPLRLSFQPLQARLDRRLKGPGFPLVDRLESLDRSIQDLARRTESMVEHAEHTARGIGREAPKTTGTVSGTREPLELVWGEEE